MIFTESIPAIDYAWTALYVGCMLLIGYAFERILIAFIKSIAKRTAWNGDNVIASSLGHIFTWWAAVLGLYASIIQLPLTSDWRRYIENGGTIIWILFATVLVMRITSGLVKMYAYETDKLQNSSIFTNLTKIAVISLGALAVLQTLDISIAPLLTAVGVGSLAIALGLQETLSNLFSGLSIIVAKKIQIGDFIQLDSGEEGYVQDIDWRHTTISAVSAKTIIVPNAVMAKAIVTNYTLLREEKTVAIPIGISYDSDLEHVQKVLERIATETLKNIDGADKNYTPLVRFKEFGDSSIKCIAILRAKDYKSHFLLKHEFIKRAHKELASEGITMPFPTQEVIIRK